MLGTAGHIDHGKTELIHALTGVDTDRLPEEKARGITIDLGFAPLDLGNGLRLDVVDVPGHEGLVRTMVAGATGIDLLLLVVAADEGVMPQTREHLAIAELLDLRAAVVALTKTDVAEPAMAELAAEEARSLLAGTALSGAPLVRVSAVTGEGLEDLRIALSQAARACAGEASRGGPPRLWIDRAFEMRGFGAVVTGTLLGGGLQVGERVEILPDGLQARVRGLQHFGESRERLAAGGRCAVNLQGVPTAALHRGSLLTPCGALEATAQVDAQVRWLPSATPLGSRRASLELLVGTAYSRARVTTLGDASLAPGRSAFARIQLEAGALPLLPGDRFVLRGFSASPHGFATLGGGRVLDLEPPRRRRRDPALVSGLERLARDEPSDAVAVRVERAGFSGLERARLRRLTGLSEAALESALTALGPRIERVGGERLVSASALEALEERALAALAAFHRAEPLRPGMPRAALRGALPENLAPAAFERLLERLAETRRLLVEEDLVHAAGFAPRLAGTQEDLVERLCGEARSAGLEPPTLRQWSERLGVPAAELQDLLAHLEREGALVRAPGDLFFDRDAVDALRRKVVSFLEAHGSLGTRAYKELIGTSRKWAVPLMELFDAERLTLRRGDTRVLRRH